jgi:competence protein ComEC
MRLATIGFASGAGVLQMQPVLPSGAMLAACLACALLLVGLRRYHTVLLAGALAGFCWAGLLASLALTPALAPADEGRDITVTGTIDSLPYHFDGGVRFNFAVEKSAGSMAPVPARVALAWYRGERSAAGSLIDVRPGERWQLTVRLQRPHGNANPHGFDYEVWLLEQGLRATGYVRMDADSNRMLDSFVWSIRNVVEHTRSALRQRVLRALHGKPYAGVIVALVVGDQRAIEQSDWQVFNRTGVGHLISISGLHITMVAGLFSLLASWLWRHSFFTRAQLPLLLPAQKAAALSGALVALLYVLLAGFGIPAQRTLYMLVVVAGAVWSGRIGGVSHVLCAALGLVVLFDPWAVLAPGFWLSFGAVAVILFATVGRTVAPRGRFMGMLALGTHTQYVVTLGLVPLTMLLFSQVSLASPFANALAIPLISLVVTPLSLAGSMLPDPLSPILLATAHFVIEALAFVLEWMAGHRLAVWTAPAPPVWVFVLALAGTIWTLAPRGWPLRWTGVIAWLPMLAGQASSPPPGHMVVTAFDVGQGMALLIETNRHRLLYDTGPAYSPESNGGNRVVMPYLRGRGIAALDAIVVSHSDSDHSGGALAILKEVPVRQVLSSLPPGHPIAMAARRHTACAAGQSWTWDGVHFEMLHPALDSYGDAALKPNARSCTLHVSAAGQSVLLAADIGTAEESQLIERTPHRLPAKVLLAPHHGSGTSSSPAFLLAVRPQLALFQVGHRNRYRHPKAEVYERYGAFGITRLRTDVSGAISLDSADGLRPQVYRETRPRYWHGH